MSRPRAYRRSAILLPRRSPRLRVSQ
jgi:hypothetical protein